MTDHSRVTRGGSRLRLLAVLGFLVGMLALAASAQAQLPGICEEYPDDPRCDVGPTIVIEDPVPTANLDGGDLGSGSGGELPFTGYPVSPLILLALLLLLLGIAARVIAHYGRKLRADSAPL